jgi:hypothetical protein
MSTTYYLLKFLNHFAAPSSSTKLSVDEVFTDSGEENDHENVQPQIQFHQNDFVIVKLCTKKTVKHYIGLIVAYDDLNSSDISIKFMKKISANKFVFPDDKVWVTDKDDIVLKLGQPLLNNREQYVFNGLSNLNLVLE